MKSKEKAGIGTDATRSDVIKKLYDGGYISDQKNHIVPTQKGMDLIHLIDRVCPELSDLALTALWEDQLSRIESGQSSLAAFDKAIAKFVNHCIQKNQSGQS